MRYERSRTRTVSLAGVVEGRAARQPRVRLQDDGRLTREDLLQVAISVVKSGGSHLQPTDFTSDVALTFEILSNEMRTLVSSYHESLPGRTPPKGSRPDPGDSLEYGLGWSKAG